MNGYRSLLVWKKAIELAKEIYSVIKLLPKDELFGLSSQLRRAAVSVPSNIAEGNGRSSKKDYIHFLNIARGSVYEIETQLLLCVELSFFNEKQTAKAMDLCEEISKMLNSLIRSLSE